MLVLSEAQVEMNKILAERRILAALTRSIPAATDVVYRVGQEVLVYQERSREWIGPAKGIEIQDKLLLWREMTKNVRGP